MSAALAALIGAFIGATASIGSGLLAEAYRRHRDRQVIASAFGHLEIPGSSGFAVRIEG
jgi:hypothetical protein